jgi:hypothetical protein
MGLSISMIGHADQPSLLRVECNRPHVLTMVPRYSGISANKDIAASMFGELYLSLYCK